MSQAQPFWTDERLDALVGNLLRAGVMLAATVVLFGAVLYMVQNGNERADHKSFHGEPARLEHINTIIAGSLELDGESVIQLGLLLLLATPVARVLLCAIVFALQRDGMYVVITLIVLTLLLLSIFGLRF